VRVLHLTDPHLFADRSGALRGAVTYDTLQSVIEHYGHGDFSADLVALTGDIIQDDSAEAYAHCHDLLSALDLPVLCVPGNHDVRHLMRDMLPEPPFSYCDSVAIGNWLIVGIDSCSAGRPGGKIAERELRRMEETIAASSAEHVMICLHHPPVPIQSYVGGPCPGRDFRACAPGLRRQARRYSADSHALDLPPVPAACRRIRG
jgi:Icc protein